jgi:hypothetical protein
LDRVPERKQLPNIDTIIAIQEVANAFNACWVPFFMSIFNYMLKYYNLDPVLVFQLSMIMISNSISAPCITILVFIHWKKGPEWWLKISPKIYFTFLILIFMILPLINEVIALILFIIPSFVLVE